VLVQADMIVVPPTTTAFTGSIVGVGVTEHGLARLVVD
jgi:hypothetical protein